MTHHQRRPPQADSRLFFHQQSGQAQAHIGQRGVGLAGLGQGGPGLGQQQLARVEMPEDIRLGKQIGPVHVIGVRMGENDIFHFRTQPPAHEIGDLLRFFGIGQRVDEDAAFGGHNQPRVDLGVHTAAKDVGVFGNAFSQNHKMLTPG